MTASPLRREKPVDHTKRRIALPYPRDPDGKPLCRWCEGAIPKGRQWWCGPECVEEYRLAYDNSHVRWLLEKRDGGVCALCGWDTGKMERILWELDWLEKRWIRKHFGIPDTRQSWWDADHIVPVVRGGAHLGLSNFRTLCIPCHKQETANLAADRARERSEARTGQLTLAATASEQPASSLQKPLRPSENRNP